MKNKSLFNIQQKNILQLFLYNKHSNEYIFILGVCTTIEIFCAHFDDRLSSKKIHSYNHFFAGMYMSSLLLDGWILQQQQVRQKKPKISQRMRRTVTYSVSSCHEYSLKRIKHFCLQVLRARPYLVEWNAPDSQIAPKQ